MSRNGRNRHGGTRHWIYLLGMATALCPLGMPTARAAEQAESGVVHAGNSHLYELQDAFSAIADRLEPAVVTVSTSKSVRSGSNNSEGDADPFRMAPFGRGESRRATGTGSGVIITRDGWVLTNDHVVGGADRVIIHLHDGREFVGKVVRDFRSDLALVKINSPESFPTAHLGDSDKIKIGYWAVAIGSPYRYEGSMSVGIISSLDRSQRIGDFSSSAHERLYPDMIQTDAAINPGNSGGPLCNLEGEVIGINTAIQSEGGGSVGIGFAIPINRAKFVINQLMQKGRVSYGYLGVSPTSVTPRLASALSVERGALIDMEPDADTPAGKAGLHAGDVVTAINNKPIRNELDLRNTVAETAPATTIELTVVRNGKERALHATLDEAPDLDPTRTKAAVAGKATLGIEVQALTEKLAERAGVSAKTAGVVIKSIDPNSAAADIDDLAEGLVILRVNDTETPTVQAFQAATANLKSGDQVRVLYEFGDRGKPIIRFAVVPVD